MSHRSDSNANVPNNVKIPLLNNENSQKAKVVGSSHAVEVSADYGIWDTVSGAFVKPEDTNFHSGK